MKIGSNPRSTLSLFIVLAVAAALILLFNIGVGLQDTLSISDSSRTIASLEFGPDFLLRLARITDSVGLRKTLLSLPTAIMYSVGGISDITTQSYPIISTLANVVLVYVLAVIPNGKKAGWLAAFLFITLPATLFTATALPLTQPIISFVLCLLIVYTNRGQSQKNWFKVAMAFTLLFIILIVLDLLLALCLLALILTLHLFESGNRRLAWLPAAIFFVSLIVGTGGTIGNVFVDFYINLLQIPEIEVLLPITFIVLILTLSQASSEYLFPVALLVMSFGGLLWRASTTVGSELIGDPLFSMLLIAVVFLVSRFFSTRHTDAQNHRASIWMPLTFLMLALIIVSSQKLFIPSFVGFGWVSLQSLLPALSLLPGLVFLMLIAYTAFSTRRNARLASILSVLLPVLFAAALIPYTWQRWHTNQPSIQAAGLAKEIIMEGGATLPIYVVDDSRLADQLDYLWNDALPSPITAVTLDTLESELSHDGGYILYWEHTIQNPPSNWWQMGIFGALGSPRLVVARVQDEAEASRILEKALASPPTLNEEFERVIGAAINVGKPCLAISTWIGSQRSGLATQDYFPLYDLPIESCFNIAETENLLASKEPILYPGYNPPIQYLGDEKNLQEGATIGPKYPFFEDPRIFYLEAPLGDNSIYAYHVELRGAENLMPLYWKIGDYENYLDYGLYNNWTPLTVLISTYGLEDRSSLVTLSPFMYYVTHYGGSVELRDLQLLEVGLVNK